MAHLAWAWAELGKKNLTCFCEGNGIAGISVKPKAFVHEGFGVQKICGTAFGQSNKILVKIRSVTAETFLIWTNVKRTNVAWINITATVDIC